MTKSFPKQWVRVPAKASAVPDSLRRELSEKAETLVESHLKPAFVQPPPKDPRYNYIVDLHTKWRGQYFYFMSKYASPGPNRIAPFFEVGFARLEYAGSRRFNLLYFRHTGKWWQIFSHLTLDEALEMIKKNGIFQPQDDQPRRPTAYPFERRLTEGIPQPWGKNTIDPGPRSMIAGKLVLRYCNMSLFDPDHGVRQRTSIPIMICTPAGHRRLPRISPLLGYPGKNLSPDGPPPSRFRG